MRFNHVDRVELPDLTSKTINGKRYYTTPEGKKYPSVTTVLGAKIKPELENWRNMLGPKKAKQETDRCSQRGDAVHFMAEHYLKNVEDPTKNQHFEHVKQFNKLKVGLNSIDNIIAQEVALYSDTLRLAGRVDCIGEFKGKLAIIDFKTSNNNKDHQMIEDYKLQCTAYAIMFHEMTGISITNMAILMSVEKGLFPLVFTDSIDAYVEPLIERIQLFNRKNPK